MTAKSTTVNKEIEDKIAAYEPKLTGKWAGKTVSKESELEKRMTMRRKALETAANKS